MTSGYLFKSLSFSFFIFKMREITPVYRAVMKMKGSKVHKGFSTKPSPIVCTQRKVSLNVIIVASSLTIRRQHISPAASVSM
jgi:hypothetical protein